MPWPAVWCVFEDSKKRLWVGTFGGGLGLFNRASQTFVRYQQREGDTASLGSNLVYAITEDAQGYLWVGTFAGGLNRFDPTTGTFQRYTQRDGLPNNFVKVALTDHNGLLWISSDRGISRYDPKAHTFTNYTTTDGLHGNVFLSGAYCKTRDGMFIFGGMSGATAFYPDSVRTISIPPPVAITSFLVYDQPYPLEQPAYAARSVALSHDQNFLAFEFSALDFTASSRNRYRYKLEGLDTGWVEAGTQRLARYTHLPPGAYTFRVIGSNKDGVWNVTGASLAITIAPPFWGTWWFRLTALAAVIAVGIGLYNYRVNRLLEIERLRVRIASDLHDDIGSSLTKISLQSELIQEGIEPSEIPTYLKNIATMSRDLVTAMSDIVWSIDARNDTIENLIEKMKSFGGGTLSAKDIRFQLAYSGLDLKKKIPVDVRENLYLIFKEAINNIAKHSAASNVNVSLRNDADGFRMFIVDDGIGWEGTRKPTGHGTRNMKMRAERLGGSIDFVRDE
ncbi:MAG TPA: triple tyrosine motif-containing protein, partial [Bacteroidota bacterium]|nr:triple tyrosine motif-containing protein [Bacteroidota bacterium]